MRFLIASIPKAGTYLVTELLRRLGIAPTYYHLDLKRVVEYDPESLDKGRSRPSDFSRKMPLASSLRRIPEGMSAVTHLPPYVFPELSDFNILFAVRDLRDVLVSYCRWSQKSERWQGDGSQFPDGPEKLLGFLHSEGDWVSRGIHQAWEWVRYPVDMTIPFEGLLGDFGEQAQTDLLAGLASGLEIEATEQTLEQALAASLGSDTLTRSSQRSHRDSWWSDEVESYFERSGLAVLNHRLGYASNAPASSSPGSRESRRAERVRYHRSLRTRSLGAIHRLPVVGDRIAHGLRSTDRRTDRSAV